MNAKDVVIETKVSLLNLRNKDKKLASDIMYKVGFEIGFKYLSQATSLPKIADHKKIGLNQVKSVIDDEKELIKFITKSNASFSKIIDSSVKSDRLLIKDTIKKQLPVDDLISLIEKKKDFKALIKQKNINFDENIDNLKKAIEDGNRRAFDLAIEYQNDDIEKGRIESNANKLKRSIISGKYLHLVNDETNDIFLEAAKQGVTKEQMRTSVASKVAAIKNAHDFNDLLGDVIGLNIEWNPEALEQKAMQNNTDVISNENGVVMLEVDNFSDSQSFGSRMWCITRDDDHLQHYLYKDNTRIVFMLDTNLDIKDKKAYTALLYKGDSLNEVYDKNDKLLDDHTPFINLNLPPMSEKSCNKKYSEYKKKVYNKDDCRVNNLQLLTMIKIKAFDLAEHFVNNKDNGYYEWTQFDLYSGDTGESILRKMCESFDKEQLEFIRKMKHKELLSSEHYKTNDVILASSLKETNDKDHVDYILNTFIGEDISKEQYCSLNEMLSNDNQNIVKHLVENSINHGIDLSNVLSAEANYNIPDSTINALIEYNPNIIEEAMLQNNKKTFINLFANNERSVDVMRECLESNAFKDENNKKILAMFTKRIERKGDDASQVDKRFLNSLEPKQEIVVNKTTNKKTFR